MTSVPIVQPTTEFSAVQFFKRSQGSWKSQRRYYTLNKEVEPLEVISFLNIKFLETGSPELIQLASLHKLTSPEELCCGSIVTWESSYTGQSKKPSQGSTVFGVMGNTMFRDRGFATPNPVIATFAMANPDTMTLKTEYSGSVFEEEIKLIGDSYRTRQTIISRLREQLTIGQYLEKRID